MEEEREERLETLLINKRDERISWCEFWDYFQDLNVSAKTYNEVQAKHSSKINQIDRSIRDLQNEINNLHQ
ncbi:hypothetical protein [Christiangramia forsetii]|uniref:Uncharacterized protein n=2 Tax=Christiangramia forsetii TaxID=411153 RepID=A0M471_CHRFK|nr:hypothetical protein [Christiangramia forsetii]GGG24104.1 hypothetical protein GCM10011532_04160 [Christiangramia forsetii]CAL67416.1 hypothetical protein GFO_2460 [Christiangramia forsetii KT0803]